MQHNQRISYNSRTWKSFVSLIMMMMMMSYCPSQTLLPFFSSSGSSEQQQTWVQTNAYTQKYIHEMSFNFSVSPNCTNAVKLFVSRFVTWMLHPPGESHNVKYRYVHCTMYKMHTQILLPGMAWSARARPATYKTERKPDIAHAMEDRNNVFAFKIYINQ